MIPLQHTQTTIIETSEYLNIADKASNEAELQLTRGILIGILGLAVIGVSATILISTGDVNMIAPIAIGSTMVIAGIYTASSSINDLSVIKDNTTALS